MTEGRLKWPLTLKNTEYGSVLVAASFESRFDLSRLPKRTRTFVPIHAADFLMRE